MNNIRTYLFAILALAFVLSSCDEDEDLIAQQEEENPVPGPVTGDSGSLNVSKYISIGNSLAAGFMDAALYTSGQDHSFPNLLAQQLQVSGVGGGAFNQPDINSANGFSRFGPGNTPLGRFELSLSLLAPVPTPGEIPGPFTGDKSALNNFAVPGMRLTEINDPSLASNPLYQRFATAPGTSTVLGEALAANPTFFTFWLGSNDALIYASGGGTDESLITDVGEFQNSLTEALGGLTQSGAQGVVVNIPPIVLTPFFRAIPYNVVTLDGQTAAQLNAGFEGYNNALAGLVQLTDMGVPGVNVSQEDADQRSVSYAAGNNPILILDDALEDYDRTGGEFDVLLGLGQITPQEREALAPYGQARPATAADLPLLSAANEIGRNLSPTAIIGVSLPIGDEFVLSASEVVNVVTARATFNGVIDGVVAGINAQAGANELTVLDIQPAFADIFGLSSTTATTLALSPAAVAAADGTLGIVVDGVSLAPDFSPNGIFSTDGLHPNPRGHGIVANLIIDLLNTTYNANIPSVNVLALRSIIATD